MGTLQKTTNESSKILVKDNNKYKIYYFKIILISPLDSIDTEFT